jgi:hypothetical protein
MSLSLINKIYEGCLFIWKGNNYLVKEVTYLTDTHEIVNVTLIDHNGKELAGTFTYQEWKESVVK